MELLIESAAQELIDDIYMSLSQLEAELDDTDEWDDEWSGFADEEDVDMPEDIDEDMIDEAIKRVRVIRQGKRMIKFKSAKPGYRVQMVNGRPKEVRMKTTEKRKRRKGQRAGKKKRRAKKASIRRKQKRSMRKRTGSMRRK